MPKYTSFKMELDGSPLPDHFAISSIVVENAVNLPDSFTATFVDPDGEVLKHLAESLGRSVTIKIGIDESTPATLFEGDMTALEVDYDAAHSGEGTRTIARGMDKAYRLHQGRKTKSWNQVTASDVAQQVAVAAGLTVGQIDATTTTYQHIVQGNLTDLEFVKKLASDSDREAVVSDGKFSFRKRAQAADGPAAGDVNNAGDNPLQLVLKGNLIALHATIRSSGQVKDVEVRGWDPEAKQVVTSTAAASTSTAHAGVSPASLAATAGNATHVSVGTPYGQASETEAAAQGLADNLASAFAEIEGTVEGDPALTAGAIVSLGNVGAPIDGKYVLTSTSHRLDPRGYETSFVISGQQDRSLLGLVAGGVGGGGDHRFPGVMPGIVSNVQDPNKQGRVKVKLPWMDESYESDWARMVHFGAGRNRGSLFIPEVDDEVLIACEQGDPRRPFVIGGLYNGNDEPNQGDGLVDSSGVKRRGIVSKTGSMFIFFDDTSKDGIALLSSDKGLKVSLNKTKKVIHIASNGEVKIEGTDKVTVDGGQALILKGQQITIGDSSSTVEVKGSQVKVSGQAIQLGM